MADLPINDISAYAQPWINWPVYAEHTSGALLRTGQGAYGEDNQTLFKEHYDNCLKYGILRGLWHFHQPDQPAKYQVAKFLEIYNLLSWKPKRNYLDVEDIVYNVYNADGSVKERVSIRPPSKEYHTVALMEWCDTYKKATGNILGFYTRADYWNTWVIPSKTEFWYGGIKYLTPDWSECPLWIASWYNYQLGDPRLPRDWNTWILHQYEGGTGRTEGILGYNNSLGPVDQNRFNGNYQEMLDYFGGKDIQPTMANIYKKSTPMADRAWVMEVKPDQKITAGISTLGVDAVILPMVNTPWNGSHSEVLPEPTFSGRFTEAGSMPVFGKVEIDAGIATTEQHTQPEFDGHTVWQNIYVTKILDAWHVGPWTQSNLKPSDFRQIKALVFEQTSTMDHFGGGKPILDFWQAYMFKYVVDKIRVLMGAGAIPNIPIILKTTSEWLQKYPKDFAIMLSNVDRKNWLYLMLSDPKLESTSIMPDLYSIFKYAPSDDYAYPFVPDGYGDRVMLYEFTAGKQRMSFATGTAYLSKAFDKASEFNKWIGVSGSPVEPPIEPPVEPPPTDTDLKQLEQRVLILEVIVKNQGVIIEKMDAYLKSIPKYQ